MCSNVTLTQESAPKSTNCKDDSVMTTREKQFPSSLWIKISIDSSSLQRHLRVHSGKTPHSCPKCSKLFAWSSKLPIHLRTHSGEKPYICLKCSKSFSRSDKLNSHIDSGVCNWTTDCKDDPVMNTGGTGFNPNILAWTSTQLIWFFKVISYFNSENVAVLQSYYVCIRIWIAIQYFSFYFYFLSSVFCGHFSVEVHNCTENLIVICYWILRVLGNESVLCSRHAH
jgi:hypothetical protein